ncbi:hypothetical protein Tco_0422888 [Tanacetum coccineum]
MYQTMEVAKKRKKLVDEAAKEKQILFAELKLSETIHLNKKATDCSRKMIDEANYERMLTTIEENDAETEEDVTTLKRMMIHERGANIEDQDDNEENMKKAEEETQVESEEDVLYDGSNSDDERLPVESESEGDEQLEKVTIPKKGKGSKAEKPYPTYNTRSSPKPMYEAMMTLSDPQKKCLKDMGFERMIHFPIVELFQSAIGLHAHLTSFTQKHGIRLEKGSIKATRQKVQDMLGIPMGSKKLEDLE